MPGEHFPPDAGPGAMPLPAIRQDLRLFAGAPTVRGAPTWLIHDPVRHRYFSISREAFELLSAWSEPDMVSLQATAAVERCGDVEMSEIEALIGFLSSNGLLEMPPGDDSSAFLAQSKAGERSLLTTAVHSYLFFRIPLWRPQRFLTSTLPIVRPLFSRTFAVTVGFLTISGLYLVSRRWDAFVSTFLHFLTLEGFLVYGLSLIFIKTLHELGHAYVAVKQGVRVNTMGIAFLVMMPVLYTDVSDAWRLTSRRARLRIDSAGILVELAIAGIATFLWAFLPDGPMRSAAFLLATASWILSLFVNLNPFMRFDGYYLLADAWGIANLQERSSALARWRLRELLFGLKKEAPEHFPAATQRLLILYAYCVWIYRFFLFLGIALLIYFLFFKVLGVVLFAIELIWFIGLPIWRELREWWKMRQRIIRTARTLVSGALAAGLVAGFVVPWSGTVRIPAVHSAPEDGRVVAPMPALVTQIHAADRERVAKDDILFQLTAPHLTFAREQSRRRVHLLQARLSRLAGSRRELADSLVVAQQLAAEEERARGLDREIKQLSIRAPRAGILRDLKVNLHTGQWVAANAMLGTIVDAGAVRVQGFIPESELWRISAGIRGQFVPDDPLLPTVPVILRERAATGIRSLDDPYLASVFGGSIAVERGAEEELYPIKAHYRVLFDIEGDAPASPATAIRGVVLVDGKPESFAVAILRRILQVLVRESGV